MNFADTNPFIRFARTIGLSEATGPSSSRDCRLVYVLSGAVKIKINETERKLEPYDALLWPSGEEYTIVPSGSVKIIMINFDYTQKKSNEKKPVYPIGIIDFDPNSVFEHICFDDAKLLNAPLYIQSVPELEDKLKNVISAYSKKELYSKERSSALLKDVIIDMLQSAVFMSNSVMSKIEQVILYISSHYSENISNEDIAATVSYHPYHLNKLIQKYTGLSLHKYLLNFRLEKAAELLLSKSYSVQLISEKCGFSSSYHLSNAFKKKYGVSPKAYRQSRII